MATKKYDPEKEIKKLQDENKIVFTDPIEYNSIKSVGFLNLVHNELLSFLETPKKNGFYILYISDPVNKEAKYGFRINYKGGEVPEEILPSKEMELRAEVDALFSWKKNNEALHTIAEYLVKKYFFKSILGEKSDEIFVYEDGIYKSKGKEIIRVELEGLLKERYSSYRVREINHKIAAMMSIEREELDQTDEELICLNNGILNLRTMKLIPHNEDIIFLTKIPVDYKPEAECPLIEKFLEQGLYEEDIEPWLEWIGYHLYRRHLLKTAAIHVGEGDTAKTTTLLLQKRFIGERNIAEKSLQDLTIDKFSIVALYKKHANIHDDMSSQDITNTGKFKQITGNSPLDGQYKFCNSFGFMNFAKLTFACNKIPQTKEVDDEVYYNRWMIFRHDNIFDKKDPSTDPKIIDKLTTDEELSGLLNLALKGLKKVLKKNRFSYDKNWEEIREIMHKRGSPISSFVKTQMFEQEGVWISTQDLFDAHIKYCKEQKLPQTTKDKFCKTIGKYCLFMVDGRHENKRGWYNIRVGSWKYEKH
ncbi:hypothetical protein ES703_36686 [subsurface metagenome]